MVQSMRAATESRSELHVLVVTGQYVDRNTILKGVDFVYAHENDDQ